MRTIIINILLFITLIPCELSAYVEILTPPEHSSTTSDQIILVGRTSAPMLEIIIDGRITEEVIPFDGFFHARLKFGYGLHEIVIKPIMSGDSTNTEDIVEIDVLSSPQIPKKYKKMFVNYNFHYSEEKEYCIECHGYAEVNNNEAITSSEICFECHTQYMENFQSHIPDDSSACNNCHTIMKDLSMTKSVKFADKNPCYTCHKDKISEFVQDYIHGPVAGGSCTICHNPHGSKYNSSLVNAEVILCASCHSVLDDTKSLKVQHEPFDRGECGGCHDSHATNNKWVLVKNSQDVCFECHAQDKLSEFHNHPYNVKPKHKLQIDLKLADSGVLECLSCHNPHATNTKHLLRASEKNTCTACHADR